VTATVIERSCCFDRYPLAYSVTIEHSNKEGTVFSIQYSNSYDEYWRLQHRDCLFPFAFSDLGTEAGPVEECGFLGIYLLLPKSAPSESITGPVCVCVVRIEGEGPK